MSYNPYFGYSPASNLPSYYDPYSSFTNQGQSMQQAQQMGQAGVPGRDTAMPAAQRQHGGPKRRLKSPDGTEVREFAESDPKFNGHLQRGWQVV